VQQILTISGSDRITAHGFIDGHRHLENSFGHNEKFWAKLSVSRPPKENAQAYKSGSFQKVSIKL
jgi:hypothetical protein